MRASGRNRQVDAFLSENPTCTFNRKTIARLLRAGDTPEAIMAKCEAYNRESRPNAFLRKHPEVTYKHVTVKGLMRKGLTEDEILKRWQARDAKLTPAAFKRRHPDCGYKQDTVSNMIYNLALSGAEIRARWAEHKARRATNGA